MKKYTQAQLRQLVRLGVAENCADKPGEYMDTLCRPDKVGYNSGIYGINGGLLRDGETGQLYAVIGRCTNLFRVF